MTHPIGIFLLLCLSITLRPIDAAHSATPGDIDPAHRKPFIFTISSHDFQSFPEFRRETRVYKKAGKHEILLDLYLLAGQTLRPAVVFIHGGGFILGNRTSFPDPLRDALLVAGYNIVSIDHRLAPESKLISIIQDVKDAYVWLRQNGPTYRIDPNHLGVIGCSAGGYLAIAVGALTSAKPRTIVLVSALTDLGYYLNATPNGRPSFSRTTVPYNQVRPGPISEGDEKGRLQLCQFLIDNGWFLYEVLGFHPREESERLKELMMIPKITEHFPPTLVIHARQDEVIPFSEAQKLVNRLAELNIAHQFHQEEKGHNAYILLRCPLAITALVGFLDRHLR